VAVCSVDRRLPFLLHEREPRNAQYPQGRDPFDTLRTYDSRGFCLAGIFKPLYVESTNEVFVTAGATDETLTSQVTSQSDDLASDIAEIFKESGSSGWTRTSNPPVNSRDAQLAIT
jgi:hypothetical protein